MRRDSISNTLIVATVLCVVCSVLVSGAAVGLRSIQEANKTLDRNKNVLLAAGLLESKDAKPDQVRQLFDERIERQLIDLDTGEVVDGDELPEGLDLESYDPRAGAKNPDLSVDIDPAADVAGIKRREKYSYVYRVNDESGQFSQLVVPIYGKGLWSTVYGFLALRADLNTVAGITFYEHGETPGLGGEVESAKWQGEWVDKSIYGDDGAVALRVIKGAVDNSGAAADYQIDGLSGATITSNGVTNMIQYWLGPDAFGPYLDRVRGAEEQAGG